MRRAIVLLYGVVSYVVFLAAFLYAIGFTGNLVVPKSIDSGPAFALKDALLFNVLLLALFAIQHTIMARPAFKRWFTKIIPVEAERSTFVLLTSLILFLIYWKWRAVEGVVWDVSGSAAGTVLWALFWIGWILVLVSTFLVDHFDLFGLRQVYLAFRGKEYHHPPFTDRSLYAYLRHPLLLGFIIAFWATPTMTVGHLLFAAVTTAYIFVGTIFEEKDLVDILGEPYRTYRMRVRRFLPIPKRAKPVQAPAPMDEPGTTPSFE